MAVGNLTLKRTRTEPKFSGAQDVGEVVPVSIISDWVECCTAPETADNAGSTVTAPLGITRTDQNRVSNVGRGTSLQIRLKYDAGISAPTSPVSLDLLTGQPSRAPRGGHRAPLLVVRPSKRCCHRFR